MEIHNETSRPGQVDLGGSLNSLASGSKTVGVTVFEPSSSSLTLAAILELAEQAEELEVEPDQG